MNKEIKKIKQGGITLIALVITIIVLLILAGVTIATLTGENGILEQVYNAKKKTTISEIIEEINLSLTNYEVQDKLNKNISLDKYIIQDLKVKEETLIYYEEAKALVFEYKNYLVILDELDMQIKGIAGNIIEKNSVAVMYEDLMDEGKYILQLNEKANYNELFWMLEEKYSKNLKTVIENNNLEQHGDRIFQNCTGLQNVYLSNNLTTLGNYTFEGCKNLQKVILPQSVTEIRNESLLSM